MIIQADGKYLNTAPLDGLITQGEENTQTVQLRVDRFYEGVDLSVCSFVMRGVNAAGEQTEQVLTKATGDAQLTLSWQITAAFTARAGRLALELRAVHEAAEDTDEDLVLVYTMAPIRIRAGLRGMGTPLPEASDQLLNQLAARAAQILLQMQQTADALALSTITTQVSAMQTSVTQMEATVSRLDNPVVALSAAEYEALAAPDPLTLYVITEETEGAQ